MEIVSRRNVIQKSLSGVTLSFLSQTFLARAKEYPRKIVTARLESPNASFGIKFYNTQIRWKNIVAIQNVVNAKIPGLQEGMILKDFSSVEALVDIIKTGPFPVELKFINLAAGGDAFSDLGKTIVSPKDALDLANKTDESPGKGTFSITKLKTTSSTCFIQSRRGDVLKVDYEAFYKTKDNRKMAYDSSSIRGTGQPYQMVLESGDMISGMDQGLYNMCSGEFRLLEIPPILGYGSRATQAYGIPPDYSALERRVKLISIDATIREGKNNVTREERESMVLY